MRNRFMTRLHASRVIRIITMINESLQETQPTYYQEVERKGYSRRDLLALLP